MRITRPGYTRPPTWKLSLFSWLCTTACGSAIVGTILAGAHDSYRWMS